MLDAFTAFWELTTDRSIGMSKVPGPIPFTSVASYADHYNISDFAAFHFFVKECDKEFMKFMSEKAGK